MASGKDVCVVGNLPVFKLERFFAKHEFTAQYIACASDVEGVLMKDLLAVADKECLEMWENLSLMYTESKGLPLLRDEIVKQHYPTASTEDIEIVCPQEGIFLAMKAILRPSDHVISISPSYQSLTAVAESIGCEVSLWRPEERLDKPGSPLEFNIVELDDLIRPNTRLLVINFPHNPTGYLPSMQDWIHIISFCKSHDVFLFSDEMYHGLECNTSLRLPPACSLYEKAVTLSGMSKIYGMPGLRLGWLAAKNPEFRSRVSTLKDYTTICPPAPCEILALIALRNKDRFINRSLRIIQNGKDAVEAFMNDNKDFFKYSNPVAGPIAFPKFCDESMSVVEYSNRLLETCGILILPGDLYDDKAFADRFRISLGRENIPQIMKIWSDHMKKLHLYD